MQTRFMKRGLLMMAGLLVLAMPAVSFSFRGSIPVSGVPVRESFPLISDHQVVPLVVSDAGEPGVLRAAEALRQDLEAVSGGSVLVAGQVPAGHPFIVIAGTLGKCPLIDDLSARGKINPGEIRGRWESTLIEVVHKPFPGVKKALVIAGSDMRGTIFGMYDLSASVGVSPWTWWADVPVKKAADLYIPPTRIVIGSPKVRYRGIFINDEAPALSGWVHENYGSFNHRFYERVFELILRMKGNFLWPAMWGRAFYDDDPLNPQLADEYGVVIGTSHHEPMMRAHDEWRRYGSGKWNYRENPEVLREFWRSGISRMGKFESLVTVGMRGDGDEPMSREADISLLEEIIADQRKIIGEVTGKEASQTPQVWALYKEVQDYYDLGMRVPDDVTLMLCDDNWGNVRKLPRPGSLPRSGGYGMYYHFDYVGGPRNYKWLNTNPISRVWEQMHLTWAHGVDRIWIVNVGDIKPMEFPIQFFLDMAWDPGAMTSARMAGYTREWAGATFGSAHAGDIARLIDGYTRFNGRRKPELLDPHTYSPIHYREAERAAAEYNALASEARALRERLPREFHDAYDQLVLFPVVACANLHDLYVTAGRNRLYASQGRAATNTLAARTTELFLRDSLLTRWYNHDMAGGKWNHMMDQTHIGYFMWQEPPRNFIPRTTKITLPVKSLMRVTPEGAESFLEAGDTARMLPVLDTYQNDSVYAEIFNAGTEPFAWSLSASVPWLRISPREGILTTEERIWFTLDASKVPEGRHTLPVTILSSGGERIVLLVEVFRPAPFPAGFHGFAESNGHIAMEAAHYARKSGYAGVKWEEIPQLGRTHSAMTTFPVTAPADTLPGPGASLEYDLWVFTPGEVTVTLVLSPSLNYYGPGHRIALSFDDQPPQILPVHGRYDNRQWEQWMRDNAIYVTSRHQINTPGKHVLKLGRIDPGVVVQKIILDMGGVRKSYLGPPAFPVFPGGATGGLLPEGTGGMAHGELPAPDGEGAALFPANGEGVPVVVSTWGFGVAANEAAWEHLAAQGYALDAVEAGARVPEADPAIISVGYGGLPDARGRVTLDACIMDEKGNAGAVACLEEIRHPISVARRVMEKTPHVLLTGKGALDFALSEGFRKEKLLTPAARKAWRQWKQEGARFKPVINIEKEILRNHDTIGLLALDSRGRLCGATTTSGMAFKMNGRVGDSPLPGAGIYVDGRVGGAVATGSGELVMKTLGAFLVVEFMRQGMLPEEACREAVLRITAALEGYQEHQIGYLALDIQGRSGAFSLQPGFEVAHRDSSGSRLWQAPSLLP